MILNANEQMDTVYFARGQLRRAQISSNVEITSTSKVGRGVCGRAALASLCL